MNPSASHDLASRWARIVAAHDGEIPSLWRSYWLRYVLIWILGYAGLAGLIFSLVNVLFVFRRDHRCIHDLLVGTVVVRVPRAASPAEDVEATRPPLPPPQVGDREQGL